jgi:hypothetical protein
VIIAFSIIDSSTGVILPNIKFINHKSEITALLNKSHGFVSLSLTHNGKSKGLILWLELRETSR